MNILIAENIAKESSTLFKLIIENYPFLNVFHSSSYESCINILTENTIHLFFLDISVEKNFTKPFKIDEFILSKCFISKIILLGQPKDNLLTILRKYHFYDYINYPIIEKEVKNIVLKIYKNYLNYDKSSWFQLQDSSTIRICHKNILFIEYNDRACTIHCYTNSYKLKRLSLSKVIESFNNPNIIQSHKSYGINILNIRCINPLYSKLWSIEFFNYPNTALLGYKYKDNIFSKMI